MNEKSPDDRPRELDAFDGEFDDVERRIAREIRAAISPRHVDRYLGPRPLAGLGSEASRATVPRQRQALNRLIA